MCLNYDWIFCGTLCFIAFIMRTIIYVLRQVHNSTWCNQFIKLTFVFIHPKQWLVLSYFDFSIHFNLSTSFEIQLIMFFHNIFTLKLAFHIDDMYNENTQNGIQTFRIIKHLWEQSNKQHDNKLKHINCINIWINDALSCLLGGIGGKSTNLENNENFQKLEVHSII